MMKGQYALLQSLNGALHPTKTFIGTVAKGFDFFSFNDRSRVVRQSNTEVSLHEQEVAGYYGQSKGSVLIKRAWVHRFQQLALITAITAVTCTAPAIAEPITTDPTGSSTSSSATRGPFQRSDDNSDSVYSKSNIVYSAAELAALGLADGSSITEIQWDLGSKNIITATGNATLNIYFKNSSVTAATANSWTSLTTGSTLVGAYTFNADTTDSIPNFPGVEGFMPFVLDSPFVYTGGALEVQVEWDASGLTTIDTDPNELSDPTDPDSALANSLFSNNGSLNWHWSATTFDSFVYRASSSDPSDINKLKAERVNTQFVYNEGASDGLIPEYITTASDGSDNGNYWELEGDTPNPLINDGKALQFLPLEAQVATANGNGWRQEYKIDQPHRLPLSAHYELFKATYTVSMSDGAKAIITQYHGDSPTLMKLYYADSTEQFVDENGASVGDSVGKNGIFDLYVRLRTKGLANYGEDVVHFGTFKAGDTFDVTVKNEYGTVTVSVNDKSVTRELEETATDYLKFGNYLQSQVTTDTDHAYGGNKCSALDPPLGFVECYEFLGITESVVTLTDVSYVRTLDPNYNAPAYDNPASAMCSDTAGAPATKFDLTQWRIKLPDADGTTYSTDELQTLSNEFFCLSDAGDMVMYAPVNGGTAGSTYPRTELREMIDPSSSDVGWSVTGTHTLSASTTVNMEPSNGKIVIAQVDGMSTDILGKIQWDNDRIRVQLRQVNSDGSTGSYENYWFDEGNTSFPVGTKFDWSMVVKDGVLSVTVNDETVEHDFAKTIASSVYASDELYFSTGSQPQDNALAESAEEAGEVLFHSLVVTHADPDAPAITRQTGNYFEGTGTSGATIALKDSEGNIVGTATVGDEGTWSTTLTSPTASSEQLTITQTVNGITSVPVTPIVNAVSVTNDNNAIANKNGVVNHSVSVPVDNDDAAKIYVVVNNGTPYPIEVVEVIVVEAATTETASLSQGLSHWWQNLSGWGVVSPALAVGASDFTVETITPFTIANGSSETVTISFNPSAEGLRDGTVIVRFSDGSVFTFTISGNGTVATLTSSSNAQNIPVFGPFGLLAMLLGLLWFGKGRRSSLLSKRVR